MFQKIKAVENFEEIFNQENFVFPSPQSIIITTDIVNSTTAIQNGKYRDVNSSGALAIMAIANYLQSMNFAYTFGGDGMFALLHEDTSLEELSSLFAFIKEDIKNWFQLELRVLIQRMNLLLEENEFPSIAKLRIHNRYDQAIFIGQGLDKIDSILKSNAQLSIHLIKGNIKPEYTGFSCRWKDISSPYGETLALLIRYSPPEKETHLHIQQLIKNIYGTEEQYHPVQKNFLKTDFSFSKIQTEARALLQNQNKNILAYLYSYFHIFFEIIMTTLAYRFQLPLEYKWFQLNKIREQEIEVTDIKKYDGTLKMVLSGNENQRKKLISELNLLESQKKICYGLHTSPKAIMTCLVAFHLEGEVHFVDGGEGGYAIAAIQLKQKLKMLK